ncbi:ABC-F family ATP-binding cassette domain-containing protein [Acidomonas methanolica]|uniref:ABC transporter n=3 Tax=Acidomonas methanolica TaxID=437 RepID=A0A023D2J8_ACIMT|nr:ATP-binding cassette domain-containing protein [Acidomonas methanolica]MBU2652875.1 ATP-binding cassette domain-containing protein [Acidomonas methanolica]TCS31279.1 ATP-binding cassette subfamily F protein uup [Acidomonas methanolica]GAJ27990.1 ABC transporter [Acidomonas methanolica NBRC 104435]GEK98473.1 elongation factor 3 [Acidomonas methanolica NBRC 104435]
MAPPLLLLQDIVYSLGGRPLLDGAAIGVQPGERVCLVGRNGSGKSTLLRLAAGEVQADSGTRFLQPGARAFYLAQEPDLSGFSTTYDYVSAGLEEAEQFQARAMLAELGLSGGETAGSLSGGEARRAALARALASRPDLLLLDEPTNHLDMPAIAWLEKELIASRAAMIVISHDRRLLETLSRAVVWLDQGVTRRLEQGFARFESWREEVLEQEETEAHKLTRRIAREEDWMRYGVTARRKRNVRRVAELAALRVRRKEMARGPAQMRMSVSDAETTGKITIAAENVGKSYGDRAIVRDLDLRVLRGDRLGIVGANGAGKTTLLHLLTGEMAPDAGTVTLGPSVSLVTLDQRRAALDPAMTLADTLTGGSGDMVQVGGEKRHVIGYMKDFLFRPEQARTPVGSLSGGERGRLALACALARPSNLIVLDEPTNDLDLETLDLLQEMLADYAGTVLLVSHDRDFLDRVATSVLVAEGDGKWIEYAGGYSDMLAQRPDSAPRRDTFRPVAASPGGKPQRAQKKLSYKDQRVLDSLPGEIAAIEAEIVALREKLADPALYQRDPAGFQTLTATLETRQADLTQAEERWIELETKREELERT